MNYDYLVPGNHDFNYGREFFSDFIENSNANFLCGNILKDDKPLVGKEYEVIEFEEGLKVAVIGITTNFIPIWEKKEHIDDLVFINAFEKTKEIVLCEINKWTLEDRKALNIASLKYENTLPKLELCYCIPVFTS